MSGDFWWSALRSLAVFLLAGSLGITLSVMAARRKGIDVRLRDILSLTADLIRFTASRMAANITTAIAISFVLFGALCWSHGYYFRGARENRQRYTYTDVLILVRHDAKTYDVRPARMEAWQAGLCEDNDWQPWQKLRRFSFQVRKDSKGDICLDAFEGGYEFYTKDGKRILYPQEKLTDARY